MTDKLNDDSTDGEGLKEYKAKFEAKLSEDDRNASWFHKKYVGAEVLSYFAMMNQLRGVSPLRYDIKEIIDNFISGKLDV